MLAFLPAYLDPGTGSMLIQFLVAAVGGVVFFFSNIKQIVLGFLGKKTAENNVQTDDDATK